MWVYGWQHMLVPTQEGIVRCESPRVGESTGGVEDVFHHAQFTHFTYQSADAAIPDHRVPRRATGISGPEINDITRTPPSKKVCFPPRNGMLVQWSSGPPLSLTKMKTVLSHISSLSLRASITVLIPLSNSVYLRNVL